MLQFKETYLLKFTKLIPIKYIVVIYFSVLHKVYAGDPASGMYPKSLIFRHLQNSIEYVKSNKVNQLQMKTLVVRL